MWYSKPQKNTKVVDTNNTTDSLRAFHWDLCDVWFATSIDGYKCKKQGIAISRGKKGATIIVAFLTLRLYL